MVGWSTCRNSVRLALLALLLFIPLRVGAAEHAVSLLLGDVDSFTAVQAVRLLRADARLRQVRFHIYPTTGFAQADHRGLLASQTVFVMTVGRRLVTEAGPQLRAVAAAGGRVYAVGATYDSDFDALGLTRDDALRAYMEAGGPANVADMVRAALARDRGMRLSVEPPRAIPEAGLLDVRTGAIHEDFDAYARMHAAAHPALAEKPWVGISIYRSTAMSGQTAPLEAIVRALEARGLRAAPVFGYPSEAALERFLLTPAGKARVVAIVAMGMKIGMSPDTSIPVLKKLDVPVINAITLYGQSRAEWEASATGLDIVERAWQVAAPEFGGLIAPTVVASKEPVTDEQTGLTYVAEQPIAERVERLADRVRKWAELRFEMPAFKRVAVLYYNYPPGKFDVGAAYLDVLPDSLWQIVTSLERAGYDTRGRPDSAEQLFDHLHDHGNNVGAWAPGALDKLVRSGHATLLPIAEYERWFAQLPQRLRDEVNKAWGAPQASRIMVWKDARGEGYFVFPTHRFGNVLLVPQPVRGWHDDPEKLFHDVTLPPHHQYLALYLWLQKNFRAHAMMHVGTHATHEWLSGKQVGFTEADPGEVVVGEVPQLYFFIMDDIGEALQAKRRGMATMVSHLTPPFDRASLNPELRELEAAIDQFHVAGGVSEIGAQAALRTIDAVARRMGLLTDLGIEAVADHEHVEQIEHHLHEIEEDRVPFGLHKLGVAPDEARRRSTAEAILSLEPDLSADERARRTEELSALLVSSAAAEIDAMVRGLGGGYVAAGNGGDPMRSPHALPTGRNLFGFDPTRVPTQATYAEGARLAEALVHDYRKRHGVYPDRLVFNLWGVESSRHEGIMEGQILALLGVNVRWDPRGRVAGVEVIPREALGRPRIDVTIVPSGLYRDLFSPVMQLLDQAVAAVAQLDEADNMVRTHTAATQQALIERGVPLDEAQRLARVRMFSVPSGAYGTNLERIIPLSNRWTSETQVADVYFMRMGHLYGQGFWGDQPHSAALAVDLLKMGLKGAKAVVHSRTSNTFGVLDSDDFYQYLGGTAMAARQVNGKTPEVMVADLSNPRANRQESLQKYMGRELRARYLNPKWIEAMLDEGYSGARFVHNVVEYMWGWQVTVPEAVDAAKWQEMYETYVTDRHGLDIKQRFRDAKNLLAYQALVDRMLVAVNKGYWNAPPEVIARLQAENLSTIQEAGVSCWRDTCSSPDISDMADAQDRAAAAAAQRMPAPVLNAVAAAGARAVAPAAAGALAQPAAESGGGSDNTVQGFEMQEETRQAPAIPPAALAPWLGVAFLMLLLGGFVSARRRG